MYAQKIFDKLTNTVDNIAFDNSQWQNETTIYNIITVCLPRIYLKWKIKKKMVQK